MAAAGLAASAANTALGTLLRVAPSTSGTFNPSGRSMAPASASHDAVSGRHRD
jgi:hypothetical protein